MTVWSDWNCTSLEVDAEAGDVLTLEIYQTDCGHTGHWGYAYVDDICEACVPDPCNTTGSINLNPTDSCWDITGTFDVCGTYSLPAIECNSGGLDSIQLFLNQNGTSTLVNVNPVINNATNSFCFTLDINDFPNTTQGFDFQAVAHYTINGAQHTEDDFHTNPGQHNDIVFSCIVMESCFLESIKPVKPWVHVVTDKPTIVTAQPGVLPPYIHYEPVNRTITSPELWDGKVYIPNNVIVTVENTLLDLTNVDVIFGECAGIHFTGESTIRANNSVFRPCEMNNTWYGFFFSKNAGGVINESTFKNAQNALFFSETRSGVKIVNNLFENCRNSIYAYKSEIMDGITGNTFYLDKNEIKYSTECERVFEFDYNYYKLKLRSLQLRL